MIPISLYSFRSNWLASDLHRRRREASCLTSPPQTLDTDLIFCRIHARFGARGGRCLNVICDNVEVWCVPSATKVPSVPRSQNKGFSIRVLPYLLQLHSVLKYRCMFLCSEQCWSCIVQGFLYLLFSFNCVFTCILVNYLFNMPKTELTPSKETNFAQV